ncbi:hypothetical protein [Agromyces soli]|uniref:Uncharacterized protein n=1 Tax=Agromyces soli TaxID=659012 RepID=A0ABY4AS94_9MICO|nr:hypothetical protein [Agromyces soli]UOE26023.1 hypothetical protein MTP13_17200 [Agromyces soli]
MSRIRRAVSRLAGRPRPSRPASSPEIMRLEGEIAELRRELDELRSEARRAAELYDLVFEGIRREDAAR